MFAGSQEIKSRSNFRLQIAIALWLAIGAAGMSWLHNYASTAGPATTCAKQWPDDLRLPRTEGVATLVVFIHPHCSCTTSTLQELERLLADVTDSVQTVFVFGIPQSTETNWVESTLWNRTGKITSSRRVLDPGGSLASRFGALNSGHCLLFSPAGDLVFEGGVTSSRAHEGEAYGRVAIRQLLNGNDPITRHTPVFGCELIRKVRGAASSSTRQEAQG